MQPEQNLMDAKCRVQQNDTTNRHVGKPYSEEDERKKPRYIERTQERNNFSCCGNLKITRMTKTVHEKTLAQSYSTFFLQLT